MHPCVASDKGGSHTSPETAVVKYDLLCLPKNFDELNIIVSLCSAGQSCVVKVDGEDWQIGLGDSSSTLQNREAHLQLPFRKGLPEILPTNPMAVCESDGSYAAGGGAGMTLPQRGWRG